MTPENIPFLLEKIDALYDDAVKRGKPFTKLSITKTKIVEARSWQSSLPLIEGNFEKVLADLKIVYVPKVLQPGPMFLFPIIDTENEINYAQAKPLAGSIYEERKYTHLGIKPFGPLWLGNDLHGLDRVVQTGMAILVEGPFDLLACRLVAPEAPVLCPLTKKIGKEHQAYLRMLGIGHLCFLYDNEITEKGQIAAKYQAEDITGVRTEVLTCPTSDPSESLKNLSDAKALQKVLMLASKRRSGVSLDERL